MIISSNKYFMKDSFASNGVLTPSYVVIHQWTEEVKQKLAKLTFPLLVKPGDSYGSVGLHDDSVVKNMEDTEKQVKKGLQTFSVIIVEEFVQVMIPTMSIMSFA
jgi:D-alanine-D-alanine ligase-like ATP-grasp enzyme